MRALKIQAEIALLKFIGGTYTAFIIFVWALYCLEDQLATQARLAGAAALLAN